MTSNVGSQFLEDWTDLGARALGHIEVTKARPDTGHRQGYGANHRDEDDQ